MLGAASYKDLGKNMGKDEFNLLTDEQKGTLGDLKNFVKLENENKSQDQMQSKN